MVGRRPPRRSASRARCTASSSGAARGPAPGHGRAAGARLRGPVGARVRRDVLGAEVGVGAVGAEPGPVGAGRGPRRARHRRRGGAGLVRAARRAHPAGHRRRPPGRHPRRRRRRCSASTPAAPIDPQLHTHAMIWPKVQDPTGQWLALDARFLKRQQRTIGWIYDAALRTELTARLGVDWDRSNRRRPGRPHRRPRAGCGTGSRSAPNRSTPSSPSWSGRWVRRARRRRPRRPRPSPARAAGGARQPARQDTRRRRRRAARRWRDRGRSSGSTPTALPGGHRHLAGTSGRDRRGWSSTPRSTRSPNRRRPGCAPT